MDVPERAMRAHVTLSFYEVAVVPLSFLAVFFALLLAAGVLSGIELVGDALAIGSTAQSVLRVAVVAATVGSLSALGGVVVRLYQGVFDRSFGSLAPLQLCAIPLVAFVGALGYGVASGSSITAPWWIALIAIVSAHALVFRSIAVFSMLDHAKRTGSHIGTIAALPAVLALVSLITEQVLGAGMNAGGTLVVSTLDATGIPQVPATLLLAPITVGSVYGLTTREGTISTDTDRLSLPVETDRSLLDRLRPSGESTPSSRASGESSVRNRSGGAPPPSSPHASNTTGRSNGSTRDRSNRSVFRGGSSGTDGTEDSSFAANAADSAEGTSNTSDDAAQTTGGASTASTSAPSESDRVGDESSPNSADTEEQEQEATSEANTESGPTANGSGTETRIFTDDFGEYAGATGSNASADTDSDTCPECATDLPADSVYCPSCGSEIHT
ncbi:hypothetical protein C479_15030 [Halovivax asiaticus JCM 14624]|uniref:Zinc-ribbon domain-containing protein n=1 Tax=Halovivax asiaticus JCM 14624 TaxID=1227490 RepID=M0BBA4_9EURY|nr:hypothetical protein [Halovivax asiaticus]ELZ07767.1 hypothetical protein C479_15030 [Halovivax asiaticus JCM 14624]